MALSMKSKIKAAIELLPGGTMVNSIKRGAGSLLLKKAAEDLGIGKSQIDSLLNHAQKLAKEEGHINEAIQQEEEGRFQLEMEILDNISNFSPKLQKWRTFMRPTLVFILVGLMAIGGLIEYILQIFEIQIEFQINKNLLMLTLWVVSIWFASRGLEKLFNRTK